MNILIADVTYAPDPPVIGNSFSLVCLLKNTRATPVYVRCDFQYSVPGSSSVFSMNVGGGLVDDYGHPYAYLLPGQSTWFALPYFLWPEEEISGVTLSIRPFTSEPDDWMFMPWILDSAGIYNIDFTGLLTPGGWGKVDSSVLFSITVSSLPLSGEWGKVSSPMTFSISLPPSGGGGNGDSSMVPILLGAAGVGLLMMGLQDSNKKQ